jgi:hypothetical protein
MPTQSSLSWVLCVLFIALAALTAGAVLNMVPLAVAGALLFCVTIVASAVSAGRTSRYVDASHSAHLKANAALDVARHHTLLAALSYAWAACGFAAVYTLSDLVWYHAYQYGIGAFVGACGLYYMYLQMGARETATPPPLSLTALHAAAATGGMSYLISSGKLLTLRSDWPGNVIFASGGVAIIVLCMSAMLAQVRLGKTST